MKSGYQRGEIVENSKRGAACYRLTEAQISLIEKITARGDRAEIVPVKDGLKILRVMREEAK